MNPQKELELIRKILRAVNSPQTTEEFLNRILEGMKDIFECLACAIVVIDPDRSYHKVATYRGWSNEFVKGFHGLPQTGFLQEASTLDEPMVVKPGDPRFQAEGYTFEHPYRSFAALPMGIRGHRVGVLYVSSDREDAFSEDILETLWDFANLCTLILDHGNLGEQVSALSQVDPLTNMYSYKYWHEELNREIAKTDKVDMDLSLMDIKLNKFKEYNSMNGHVKGDDLLVRVSKIVSDKLCELDIPCRVGPNWHVILVGENQEAAAAIAQEILTDVEKLAAGENTKVTMSIGLSTYNKGEKERDLLRRVENAMQEARRQGGYRVNVQ